MLLVQCDGIHLVCVEDLYMARQWLVIQGVGCFRKVGKWLLAYTEDLTPRECPIEKKHLQSEVS